MASLNRKEVAELLDVRKHLDFPAKLFSPKADARIGDSEAVRAFIEEHTRLWRNSWVLPKINRIIASAQEKIDKANARKLSKRARRR